MAGTLTIAIGGGISPGEVEALAARACALIDLTTATVTICDLHRAAADAATIDALARLALAMRRRGGRLRLRGASPALRELVELAGLAEALS